MRFALVNTNCWFDSLSDWAKGRLVGGFGLTSMMIWNFSTFDLTVTLWFSPWRKHSIFLRRLSREKSIDCALSVIANTRTKNNTTELEIKEEKCFFITQNENEKTILWFRYIEICLLSVSFSLPKYARIQNYYGNPTYDPIRAYGDIRSYGWMRNWDWLYRQRMT